MKQKWLLIIILMMMLVGIAVSSYTLWYSIRNKDAISATIENNIKEELKKYEIPDVEKLSLDESKLALAVAHYCEPRNECRGYDGISGQSPLCLLEPSRCQGANGITPIKGVDYRDGVDGITPSCYFTENQCQGADGVDGMDGMNGANGADGREIERRCNAEADRMEWRLTGDDFWQVEFMLSKGQKCIE